MCFGFRLVSCNYMPIGIALWGLRDKDPIRSLSGKIFSTSYGLSGPASFKFLPDNFSSVPPDFK